MAEFGPISLLFHGVETERLEPAAAQGLETGRPQLRLIDQGQGLARRTERLDVERLHVTAPRRDDIAADLFGDVLDGAHVELLHGERLTVAFGGPEMDRGRFALFPCG